MSDQRLELLIVSSSKDAIVELDKLISKVDKLTQALNKSTSVMAGGFKNVDKDLKKTSQSVDKSAKSMVMSFAKLSAAIFAIRRAFSVLGKAIKEAMDITEVTHMYSTVFTRIGMQVGEDFTVAMFDRMREYQSRFTYLGIDPKTIMSYQAMFGQMANAMGVVPDAAYNISESLTTVGADLASLFNAIDMSESMTKLQAGLAGQIRPLRRWGIDISKTTLLQEAQNRGIQKSIEVMTAGEKVQLRYVAMMRQMQVAMGDIAKTIETPANQLRIFKEQLTQFGRAIGMVVLPMIKGLLIFFNALMMTLTPLLEQLATFMGYTIPEFGLKDPGEIVGIGYDLGIDWADEEEGAEGVNDAIGAIKRNLQGFDEINLLDTSSANSALEGIGAEFDLGDEIEQINTRYQEFMNDLIEQLSYTPREMSERWTSNLEGLADLLKPARFESEKLKDALQNLADLSEGGLVTLWEKVLKPIGSWTIEEVLPRIIEGIANNLEILGEVIEDAKPAFSWWMENFIIPLGKITGRGIVTLLEEITESTGELRNEIEGFNEDWDLLSIAIFGVVGALAVGALALWAMKHPFLAASGFVLAFIGTGDLLEERYLEITETLETELGDFGVNLSFMIGGWRLQFEGFNKFLSGLFTLNFKRSFNGLTTFFEGWVLSFIAIQVMLINGIIELINGVEFTVPRWFAMIPGLNIIAGAKFEFNLDKIKMPTMKFGSDYKSPGGSYGSGASRAARGGIIDREQLVLAGEGGRREAIVPLENTSFVDKLASAVGTAVMAAMDINNGVSGEGRSRDMILTLKGKEIARGIVPDILDEFDRMGIKVNT